MDALTSGSDFASTIPAGELARQRAAAANLRRLGFPSSEKWRALFGSAFEKPGGLVMDESFFPEAGPWVKDLGLIDRSSSECLAQAWIHHLAPRSVLPPGSRETPHGVYLVTDTIDRRTPDRAFPWADEGTLLLKHAVAESRRLQPGCRVLDLGTGVGTISLTLASLGKSGLLDRLADATLVATDTSERALRWSVINRDLNDVSPAAVEFRRGDLGNPVHQERPFDVAFVNLPTALRPRGFETYSHSQGGEDGLAVLARLLRGDETPRLDELLAPGGEAFVLTYSLGPGEYQPGSLAVERLVREYTPSLHVRLIPHNEPMLRNVWGVKAFQGPIPIAFAIISIYESLSGPLWRSERRISELLTATGLWTDWERRMRTSAADGTQMTHIHYALLHITKKQ